MDRTEPESELGLSTEQAKALLHDVRVHQIELEAQNAELRRAQAQLCDARARYFDLYELAPVGYFSLDEQGIILQLNLGVTTLLGVTKDRALQQPLIRFIHHEDRMRFAAHRKRLLDSCERQVCELRMLRETETIWVQLESVATRGPDGALQWRATVSDVTERVRTQGALRASEARHRGLFESSRDALMTLAPPSWRFTSANAAALAMFGLAGDGAARECTLWQAAPPLQPDGRDSRSVALEMTQAAMQGGSRLFDWTYRSLSASRLSTASVLLSRVDLDGQSVLQATVRDEGEATALRARLAQADRLATMGTLAAGVAHEINNPLTYVTFNLERMAALIDGETSRARGSPVGRLAASDSLATSQELSACLRQALDGVRRITAISRGLGKFSRLDGAETRLVSLNEAVEQAVAMARNEVRFRARLDVQLGDDLPPVLASDGRLAQVFLNLLVNAAHSIEEGTPDSHAITIRTWTSGGRVCAEVRDTGCGIAPDELKQIFEPFFTTKQAGGGSGLGLSISRTIVREFAGRIEAHSVLGSGSRFVLEFPAAARAAAESAQVSLEAGVSTTPRGRVLVVDDEPGIRTSLDFLLRECHDVVLAASGAEARALLMQDRGFDVILCDVMMPGMSGLDLHAWLRVGDRELAERMVFVSGGAFTAKAASYLASVDNARLEKPFEVDALMTMLKTKVELARRAAASKREVSLS